VTAKIGDPSGRSKERPPLSDEDIARNIATYREQMTPFVDFTKAELRHNSEWLNALTLPEIMRTLMRVPLAMQLQREDFRKRLEGGHSLSTAELLYSILMAYDSLALEADIEIGGVDQLLNFQMCRKVMEVEGKEPEVVVTTTLIEGTDGAGDKMSKSKGNYIALSAEPHDMFGKVMSISDRLLEPYFKMLTELADSEWEVLAEQMQAGTLNPVQVKKLLAYDIVQTVHGAEAAGSALAAFEAQFSKRALSEVEALPELHCAEGLTVLAALTTELRFSESNTKARALANGGGVQVVVEGDTTHIKKLAEADLMRSCAEVVAEARTDAGAGETVPVFLKVGRKAARLIDK
jgi:tyrosyl-tRNA synthetase